MALYEYAHEDEIDLIVTIDWSNPITHDVLYSGLSDSDETAYFYAIVGRFEKQWWAYYIGKVNNQYVSQRHKNQDHKQRLRTLRESYPDTVWHITLGTPHVEGGRVTSGVVDDIEGLLIYSHWHEETINKLKISRFSSSRSIKVINRGFSDPFYKEIGYGVFCSQE